LFVVLLSPRSAKALIAANYRKLHHRWKMNAENSLWRSHVILVALTACAFAAVPFSMRGLSIEVTELAATIVFSSTIAAYILVMKLCGVQRQLSGTRNQP
jgi:hypothetical protein